MKTTSGNKRFLAMGFASVLLLAALAGVAGAADRPALMGFAPAYLADSLPEFNPPGAEPYTTRERIVTARLEIDASGAVISAEADSSDGRYLAYVDEYLRALKFHPARRDDEVTASVLPVKVRLQPRQAYPSFVFPVTVEGTVEDRGLFFDAAGMNGFESARVVSFPPYFAVMDWTDTTRLYPYVMLSLDLDTAGRVTALDTVASTFPEVNKTTASASLWAEYEPARVDGRAVASRCFLVVAYFPQTMYPTQPLRANRNIDSLPPQERWRVQLLADTVGYMIPPVPRRAPGDRYKPQGAVLMAQSDTVSAATAVDTSGEMRVVRSYGGGSQSRRIAREMARQIPFYPARGFDGKPLRFRGLALLRSFSDSRNIRIGYHW